MSSRTLANLIRRVIPPRYRPIGYLTRLACERTDCHVGHGVFKGMRYVETAQGSAYIPKLLGTYERELTPQIRELVARRPHLVVDLGAAEGYYAVGLARLLPDAHLIAFEMESRGREALKEMAILNGVAEQIEVRGKCEPSDLAQALVGNCEMAVVCDVEGYEERLLDPERVPALRNASVLVELHDFLVPNVTQLLRQRFQATHHITQIWQEPRSRTDFPWRTLGTLLLPKSYIDWAVSEWRPVKMSWLWMVPNA